VDHTFEEVGDATQAHATPPTEKLLAKGTVIRVISG
jgi:hypothetical protein